MEKKIETKPIKMVPLDDETHNNLKQLSDESGIKLYKLTTILLHLGIEAYTKNK